MKKKWTKLDNAAKIFPPTSNKKDPKVFRFVCCLKENVDGSILQEATNEALELFPNFRSVLKRGFFWHYLEQINYNPIIKEERKAICRPLYPTQKKKLLFRVNYYKNRINLEVYHALSDGAGALEFLKTIVNSYINKKYNIGSLDKLEYDASLYEKNADSFNKYYQSIPTVSDDTKESAYHIKGDKLSDYRFRVINGYMDTKSMLDLAHKYNTTLTGLIISVYVWAIRENMTLKEKKKSIYVDIPVNLRKYFKSQTARNFFSVIKLNYKGIDDDFESIVNYVNEFLKQQLNKDNLFKRMNKFATIEHNFLIRLIPVFIKDLVLKIANCFTSQTITTSVSNLGVITVPESIEEYIENFEVFVSTNKMQICLCSYKETLVVSFTSVFVNTDIIKDFYRKLAEMGINVTIISNQIDE